MSKDFRNEDDVGREMKSTEEVTAGSTQDTSEPYVAHKVRVPPKQSPLTEFTSAIKETFFPDRPLRSFKDQPKSKKLLLGIEAIFPIIKWSREYTFTKLKGDLIAGMTIASLSIPQDIGYAKLAGMPAHNGLYTSFVAPLIYAMMGSSRDIAVGPVAVVSLLLASMVRQEVDSSELVPYRRLVYTATFFAGATQFILGFFRLGFLVDFLSHAAIIGFMAGAAITIALQQLKLLLGIKKFTRKTDIISVLHAVFAAAGHGWNVHTMIIGFSFLIFLITARYIGRIKNKKYFWVPAIAPLISVVVSTSVVYITRLDKKGVAIVSYIQKGVNPPSVDEIYFSGPLVAKGFRIGVIVAIVALTEAIAIGRTFASMKDYSIDGNTEMVAMGTTNLVGSLTSCFVATGSFSRSAVNYMSGCHTTISNIVLSMVVLLTLLFLTPLFKYTPNAILGSIIMSAVLGLIDIEAFILIWKIDKLDFVACMGAFFGVVFGSVDIGLVIAVAISLAKILFKVTRPRTAMLGRIPRTNVYRNVQQYSEAIQIPGILIIRVDSAIYFSNSNYVRERILRWITDEEAEPKPKIEYFVLEMSPVTDIDTSGIHALEELHKTLRKRNIQLILSNPGTVVIRKFHAADFVSIVGEDNIFLTIGDAIRTLAPNHEV